ncbi:MAG: hypothetical protein ACXVRV_00585 [Gaiellaceae bacterium]
MATCAAKVRATPAGDVKLVSGGGETGYGPVEIAWYPDHLEITAVGTGPATITEGRLSPDGQNVVVEIRMPALDELVEGVPGAD